MEEGDRPEQLAGRLQQRQGGDEPGAGIEPGRIRSSGVSVPDPALMPSAAKLSGRTPDRNWKLPMI